MRIVLTISGLLFVLVLGLANLGCATAPQQEEPKSPEQKALEAEYHKVMSETQTTNRERSQVLGQAKNLFNKAGSYESKRKLGSKGSLVAIPKQHRRGSSQRTLGPVKFKYKKAMFRVRESGPGSSGSLSIHNLQISR